MCLGRPAVVRRVRRARSTFLLDGCGAGHADAAVAEVLALAVVRLRDLAEDVELKS